MRKNNPAVKKVIMISGANRGIGLEVTKLLLNEGYRLSLGTRNVNQLKESLTNLTVDPQNFNITYFEAENIELCENWVKETVEKFGGIDVLINNAAIDDQSSIETIEEEVLDLILEINVKAPLRLIKLTLPYIKKCGSGRIINIASLSGKRVRNPNVGYCISKFALMAITHSTRKSLWKFGIRVTAVCPGLVNTDMAKKYPVSSQPEELTQPKDIASIISLLIKLPNTASVAEVCINYQPDDLY